ncbi:MAG: UvrD-helicase domain-containing protein, partial [Acidobacteria bacterium]|nr:UvrD-helicase domain-containing protein [Acidobacteriota bacterium]
AKMVEGGDLIPAAAIKFGRHAPGDELAAILDEACVLARQDLGSRLIKQGEAMGQFARSYESSFLNCQRQAAAYRYEDVTHALCGRALLDRGEALSFRMDARIHHLLLDEFQDTSLPQWEVLAPLLDRLLADREGRHAAVLVADPKQSIYGWRGARPALVAYVQERYALNKETLPRSYRSSQVILDVVADVFEHMADNPLIRERPNAAASVVLWTREFKRQKAAHEKLPGYVRVAIGPVPDGRGNLQRGVLDRAVEIVRGQHEEAPRANIGVLVRENRSVAYLIAALRKAGVRASGEGGTPLTDSAPVNALLALIRLADHPVDRLARYHVARTPVGKVAGFEEYENDADARRLAGRVREQLLGEGYGRFLEGWSRSLTAHCDQREAARLQQLVELGFLWDARATLRPTDFILFVEKERVEEPSGAPIRVMTVHQSKGLEFDLVVLPQLHLSLEPRDRDKVAMALRDEQSGRVRRVYPYADRATRALFAEMQEAHAQFWADGFRDALSVIYVAMTRARYALHLVLPADFNKKPSSTFSAAALLRAALAPGKAAEAGDSVFFEAGDPNWSRHLPDDGWHGVPVPAAGPDGSNDDQDGAGQPAGPIVLRHAGGRTSNLPSLPPSAMEGGGEINLAKMMALEAGAGARLQGVIVHAWCEAIEWIDPTLEGGTGIPDDHVLIGLARDVAPAYEDDEMSLLLADFRRWLEVGQIRAALSRSSYPDNARVERELPFVRRVPAGIMRGVIDRLVLVEEERGGGASTSPAGRVIQVEVLDFKTDRLPASDPAVLQERAAFYRPQIEAYKAAMAERYALDLAAVTGALLFLRHGMKIEI